MLKPIIGWISALVAESPDTARNCRIPGDDGASFPGGDLFVGVKGKNAGIPHGASFTATMLGTDRPAVSLKPPQPPAFGDFEDRIHFGWNAEGVRHHHGSRPRRYGLFDPSWIDVQGLRIDIHKDRHGALVANGIGGGDEGE